MVQRQYVTRGQKSARKSDRAARQAVDDSSSKRRVHDSLRLTEEQLNQLGLSPMDRKSMLDPFFDTLKQWHAKEYESIPKHVSVTTLVSVWSNIMGLLRSWEPADLLQEEEIENLKAIIGGTMNATINVRRSP